MVTTSLQGASRPRVRATVVGTLIAFTVASCSGGKRVDEVTTSRTGAVTAVAPGAETPLTDLVQTVEASNTSCRRCCRRWAVKAASTTPPTTSR